VLTVLDECAFLRTHGLLGATGAMLAAGRPAEGDRRFQIHGSNPEFSEQGFLLKAQKKHEAEASTRHAG